MLEMIVKYGPYILMGMPIFLSLFIYYISVRLSGSKWKAIHKSVQMTAIFYIIAVALLIKLMFDLRFIGYISIFLIVMLGTILIIQWKKNTEVVLLNGLRLLWRISFLIFFILYVGLITYMIVLFIILQNGN